MKKYLWIALGVCIIVTIFLLVSSGKYFQLAINWLKQDQSKVIQTLEDNMRAYEEEIFRLQKELDSLVLKSEQIRKENEALRSKIHELQKQRQNINVPSDPDRLVDELHNFGIGSARRFPETR